MGGGAAEAARYGDAAGTGRRDDRDRAGTGDDRLCRQSGSGARIKLPGQPFLRQLAGALAVTEIDILRVSGVLSPEVAEAAPLVNPFPVDDPRWPIMAALWGNDPFVVQACLAVVEHVQRNQGARKAMVGPVKIGQRS